MPESRFSLAIKNAYQKRAATYGVVRPASAMTAFAAPPRPRRYTTRLTMRLDRRLATALLAAAAAAETTVTDAVRGLLAEALDKRGGW